MAGPPIKFNDAYHREARKRMAKSRRKKALLMLSFLILNIMFSVLVATYSVAPMAHAAVPFSASTREIHLGNMTGEYIYGSYKIFDIDNPNVLWWGGKDTFTTSSDLHLLKLDLATNTSTVWSFTNAGNRGYPLADDHQYVYLPDSDSGYVERIHKGDSTSYEMRPFANIPLSLVYSDPDQNLDEIGGNQGDGMIWYVQGGATAGSPNIGYYNVTENKWYNHTVAAAGDWYQSIVSFQDAIYFIGKDGGYLAKFNQTTDVFNEWQISVETNYPTTFIDSFMIDPANHNIWAIAWGIGKIIQFDLDTYTWQTYDISSISGTITTGIHVIGDWVVWHNYDSTFYAWSPFESATPLEGTVHQIPITFSTSGAHIGISGPKASPSNRDYWAMIAHDGGGVHQFWHNGMELVINTPTYTPSAVDVSSAPGALAEQLGITSFAAGLVLGLIVLAVINIPLMMLVRGKDGAKYVLITFLIASEGLNVSIGWFPVWLLVLTVIVIAGIWALAAKGYF